MAQEPSKISYNAEAEELLVTYSSGIVWSYKPINQELYNSLIASNSLAKAMTKIIHDGFIVGTRKGGSNG